MLAANKFSRCLAVAQGFVQRLLICIHCVVQLLVFFSHRPLKPEQCLHTGTSDNPAYNGFTSLVRSCTASICLLYLTFFFFFPSISCSGSASVAVVRAVMLSEADCLSVGCFTGECVLPVSL